MALCSRTAAVVSAPSACCLRQSFDDRSVDCATTPVWQLSNGSCEPLVGCSSLRGDASLEAAACGAQLGPLSRRLRWGRKGAKLTHKRLTWSPVRALGGSGTDRVEEGKTTKAGDVGDMQALDGTEWSVRPMVLVEDGMDDPSWEHINMVFRVVYAAVMYGGLAFSGNLVCNVIGVDAWGGFDWDVEVALKGLGYAVPPMLLLLIILEDEVVKNWPAARAIRDVEDKEIMDFFAGMSPWQVAFVVAAGALSEEIFFRVAIQGGLTHALKITGNVSIDETVHGIAALTGFIPLLLPFAQGFAAFVTSSLIGSMYYIISSPKDPKYIIAHSNQGRRDLKKRVEVWYERRQLRKIYSPLMEALLALYLGVEWIQTGNIMATMVTHCMYSTVVVGNGLRRIHDQRKKLRQRVRQVVGQRENERQTLKVEEI